MFALRPLVAAVVPLLACGEPPEPTRFVADISEPDGSGVSIGLTVSGGLVAGYACGDDPAVEPYPGWFVGEAAGDEIVIEDKGWTFAASWSESGAEGRLVEPSGEVIGWSAAAVAGLSGTYAVRDAGCTTGVVVVDGADPVVRGVWCNRDGEQRQVTPMAPMRLIDGRLSVVVELASGEHILSVAPVELPLAGDG